MAARDWRPSARVLLALVILVQAVTIVAGVIVFNVIGERSCEARTDSRNAVRRLALLVTTPQDYNGDGIPDYQPNFDNGLVAQLAKDLQDGGALEAVDC